MSEDRLEKALQAMGSESVSEAEAARVRDRVLGKFNLPETALCGKFRLQFDDYLAGRLGADSLEACYQNDAPRLLLEDHLSRCPQCRRMLAELRDGKSDADAMPRRRSASTPRWLAWAAAAALIIAISYMGRASLDTALAWGPRATVDSVEGQLYLVPEGALKAGATVGENQTVRTGPASKAVLRLRDGSLVQLNERTELAVHAALSGKSIRLRNGDVIVEAAKQRRGRLRVETRDSVASVKGTVFAVSAGLAGSRVAVIEGSVAVQRNGSEEVLGPGQQSVSNPALAGSLDDVVLWSPKADEYLAVLRSLSAIEKQLAALPAKPLRTQSLLLEILPPDTVFYGAMPNIDETISSAGDLLDQQAAGNPALGEWLASANGQSLRQLLERVHAATYLLGDEIVFGVSGKSPAIPFVFAQVKPGRRAELQNALGGFGRGSEGSPAPLHYAMSDSLVSVSDTAKHLDWVNAALGEGEADAPFIDAIRRRYERGVGWLLALDIEAVTSLFGKAEAEERPTMLAASNLKHLFLEQRAVIQDLRGVQGEVDENELTLTFSGARKGLASFLAGTGSGGAAEYLPSDVLAATYISTREPRRLFGEMTTLGARQGPSFPKALSEMEDNLGVRLSSDLAAALGTEYAFGVEGVSVSGSAWVFAALVNAPAALDDAIARMVQGVNAQSGGDGRLVLVQESIDGRIWNSLKSTTSPFTATWTYDRGYMVAASSRGGVLRAISARNGGASLIRSSEFQRQFSTSLGMHPAGFAWFDTHGAFAKVAELTDNPVLREALAEREPVLAVFTATPDAIRAASRVRMSGVIMNLMLMESANN